jgi:hypothetical protein
MNNGEFAFGCFPEKLEDLEDGGCTGRWKLLEARPFLAAPKKRHE